MRHNLNRESENTDRWLVSYADFITLLFAFFVVMYSVSQVNEGKFKILSETLTDAFVQPERSLQPIQVGEVNKADTATSGENTYPNDYVEAETTEEIDESFQELRASLDESLSELVDAGLVNIRSNQNWIEINMGSGLLFKSGEDTLSENANLTLKTIVDTMNLKERQHAIMIRGYTDNIPIKSRKFSSNWSLSSARAVSVLHKLEQVGLPSSLLTVEGYGEQQPEADNNTTVGRKANRRVVMAISRLPPRKSELQLQALEEAEAQLANTTATESGEEAESEITLIRAPDGSLIIRGKNDSTDNTTNTNNEDNNNGTNNNNQ